MLVCPNCGNDQFTVLDTRNTSKTTIYLSRRRECCNCKHRFATVEIPHDTYDYYVDKHQYLKAILLTFSRLPEHTRNALRNKIRSAENELRFLAQEQQKKASGKKE